MQVKLADLKLIYDEEIKRNVRNKKRLLEFEKYKMEYLSEAKYILENNLYNGGTYNIFLVYKPKIRVVSSQSIYDKIINHYVARFILMPKFDKYLSNRNCATRKNMGTSYAIRLLKKDIESYKKYEAFYFMKLDIKKFFYTLDHEVIKNILKSKLNSEELNLASNILDSTNKSYVNIIIEKYERKLNISLPKYNFGKGLPIGNMTSQYLAILYLSKLHHYITNNLHLKFVNYMDDYIIIHESKDYLKYCLKIIEEKLNKDYKLELNKSKTMIVNANNGISFLGYNFKVNNKKTIVKLNSNAKRNIKKGIKRSNYLYKNGLITFNSYFCSIESYKNNYIFANKNKIRHIIEKYM